MIKLILLGLVVYVGYKTYKVYSRFRRFMESAAKNQEMQDVRGREIDDVMVKCPVCEVYFPKRKGVALSANDDSLLFHNAECRDQFKQKHNVA